ncbi:hypothetical protein TNCV_316091 [Trichonephila clavipes]|nr:hypothetical protein TNCV_316091 [Trichonephila clavipes]
MLEEIPKVCNVRHGMGSQDLVCIPLSHQIAIWNDMQFSMSPYADSNPYLQTSPSEMGSFLYEYRIISRFPFSPHHITSDVKL